MPDPVTVSVEVARPRQDVFDHVDVLSNHEAWLKNLYKNWSFEGPRRGVGAKARAQVDAPTAREKVDFKVVESQAPERTVEEATSAHGKRETTGTYRFTELESGRTRIGSRRGRAGATRSAPSRKDGGFPPSTAAPE